MTAIIRYAFICIAYIVLFVGFLITADTFQQNFKEWLDKYVYADS